MWPLISSSSTSAACEAASSGVSANWTPPAFMRPPVSTCDLMTTGPPMSAAWARASSALVAKPNWVVGIPARRTISRDSYSKKRIWRRGNVLDAIRRLAPVLGERHPEVLVLALGMQVPPLALVEAAGARLPRRGEQARAAAVHRLDRG